MEKAEEAVQHLSRLSENLLQLSRLEAGFAASATKTDLGEIIDVVLREPAFAANQSRIKISKDANHPLGAFITADAFAIVFRNLMENALNYGTEGGCVEVSFSHDSMRVCNDCEPFEPELLRTLTNRYVRGVSSQKGTQYQRSTY